MDEVVDVYADQFQVNTSAFGAVLNFLMAESTPPSPGTPPKTQKVATVRMSMEHLKAMTFVLRRQIINMERDNGITFNIPIRVLNALSISPEDWETFWSKD